MVRSEPVRQIEIQLGHMCNNRCVFCVSGQRTARREAMPIAAEPILAEIRAARARGHTKITLLGGEPTLQPAFLEIARECARLGFDEVVVFTNGVKTASAERVDEILATGAPITWRISIQGATEAAHDRTTRKPGSFARILRTLEHLSARAQPITVNMCVVGSNLEDLDRLAQLVVHHGARQLHLDLMRPRDAGDRSELELRAMMPSFRDATPAMSALIRALPAGFDANLGNLPFCVAPALIPWIHHDGEPTETVAIDRKDELSRPWDKYLVKRAGKVKTTSCRDCAFDRECSGVFDRYLEFHGPRELVPIRRIDPPREAIPERTPWMRAAIADALARLRRAALAGALSIVSQSLSRDRVELVLESADGGRALFFVEIRASAAAPPRSGYSIDGSPTPALVDGLRALIAALRSEDRRTDDSAISREANG
jgi:MoaA/NifB/PqqE/SkfB family radical SAM enzyme